MTSIEEIDTILEYTTPVMCTLYIALLGALIHNFVRFIWLDNQLRNFQICFFYALVLFAIVLRVTWMILIFTIANEGDSLNS